MKRLNIETMIVAALITIPLAIATVKAHEPQSDTTVRPLTEADVLSEIEKNRHTEHLAATYEEIPTETLKGAVWGEYESAGAFPGYNFIPLEAELQSRIYALCAEYEISYDLILSVIKTESEFQWLIGDNGQAVGYMQIWPYWWQEIADTYGLDIHNPVDNVHLGIIILTDALNDNSGDLDKALKQYNSGNPNYPGSEYTEKVYSNYQWILEGGEH